MSAEHKDGIKAGVPIRVGPGEFIDRLTILRLKAERVYSADSRAAVLRQLAVFEDLRLTLKDTPGLSDFEDVLAEINSTLWEAEDKVRYLAASGDFGSAYVAVARSITEQNDERARLKAEIDRKFRWPTTETKFYEFGQ